MLVVKYNQRFPEWHPQSSPYIEDAAGERVLTMQQNVEHPGKYDPKAVELVQELVRCYNAVHGVPHGNG